MKKLQFLLIIIALVTIVSSCTMEKRVYMPGVNVEWKKLFLKDKIDVAKNANPTTKEDVVIDNKSLTTVNSNNLNPEENFIASNDNSIISKITAVEIKDKNSDNLKDQSYPIKNPTVSLVKTPNISKEVTTSNSSTFLNNANNKAQKFLDDKKGGGFGITSLVLGVVGLLVGAIIFGPLAIIFGAIGMFNRKLKGLAIAGLILGIIDLIYGIIVIASVL